MNCRTINLIIVALLLSTCLYGQKEYETGYVVTLQNDTLYGLIKDSKPAPFARIYKKIRFREERSLFTKRFVPDRIKGYKSGTRVYESIGIITESRLFNTRYIITTSSKKTFLKVIQSGRLSYYHWEYLDSESGTFDYIPLFHLEERHEMVRVTQGILGIKKGALAEYFSECPDLVRKIANKEIRTPEEIIVYYEYLCGDRFILN